LKPGYIFGRVFHFGSFVFCANPAVVANSMTAARTILDLICNPFSICLCRPND